MSNDPTPVDMQTMLAGLRQAWLETLPEKIDRIETLVMQASQTGLLPGLYEDLFREVHSLKGSGGTHGLHIVSSVCHQFEDYLENFSRLNEQPMDAFAALALGYVDLLRQLQAQAMDENIATSDIEAGLAALARQAYGGHRTRTLLVAATPSLASLCAGLLDELDCKVTSVDDGMLALQRALHERFDLLVTGYENSGLNGAALIAACRLSEGPVRAMRSILMSSNPRHLDGKGCAAPDETVLRDRRFIASLSAAVKRLTNAGQAAAGPADPS